MLLAWYMVPWLQVPLALTPCLCWKASSDATQLMLKQQHLNPHPVHEEIAVGREPYPGG